MRIGQPVASHGIAPVVAQKLQRKSGQAGTLRERNVDFRILKLGSAVEYRIKMSVFRQYSYQCGDFGAGEGQYGCVEEHFLKSLRQLSVLEEARQKCHAVNETESNRREQPFLCLVCFICLVFLVCRLALGFDRMGVFACCQGVGCLSKSRFERKITLNVIVERKGAAAPETFREQAFELETKGLVAREIHFSHELFHVPRLAAVRRKTFQQHLRSSDIAFDSCGE